MTRKTVAQLDTELNSRFDSIEALLTAIAVQMKPKSEAQVSLDLYHGKDNVGDFNTDADFAVKFAKQLPRAKALAIKTCAPSRLIAVPKGRGVYSVWYIGVNRKVPQNATLLITVEPDGGIHKHIDLGALKVA